MKLEEIKAKVYEGLHKQPYGTDEVVSRYNIIIPHVFKLKSSDPKEWKMERAMAAYKEHGFVDKPILVKTIVNKKGRSNKYLLVDGYTRFLTLKKNGITKVPIKYIEVTI
jgi:ParB-like chromosome segregation protein Spo0J